jgi:hypothetical protein
MTDLASYRVNADGHGASEATRTEVLQYRIPASMVNHKYTHEQWVDVPEVICE